MPGSPPRPSARRARLHAVGPSGPRLAHARRLQVALPLQKTRWRPFAEARAWSRAQQFPTIAAWRRASHTMPPDIPRTPYAVVSYVGQWQGWDDWLGLNPALSRRGRLKVARRAFLDARAWAHAQGVPRAKLRRAQGRQDDRCWPRLRYRRARLRMSYTALRLTQRTPTRAFRPDAAASPGGLFRSVPRALPGTVLWPHPQIHGSIRPHAQFSRVVCPGGARLGPRVANGPGPGETDRGRRTGIRRQALRTFCRSRCWSLSSERARHPPHEAPEQDQAERETAERGPTCGACRVIHENPLGTRRVGGPPLRSDLNHADPGYPPRHGGVGTTGPGHSM